MSRGIRHLWEDRSLPSCCCERWKRDRKHLAMMASRLFPVPCVSKTTEGLPEGLLSDRADLWLPLPSQIEDTRHREELQHAVSHPHSLTPRLANPFIWAPRCLSGSVCGFLRAGRSKPFRLQSHTGLSLDGQPGAAQALWAAKTDFWIKILQFEICLFTPTPSTILALMNIFTWLLMFISLLDVTFIIIFLCKPFLLSAISLSPHQALGLPVHVGQLKSLSVSCLLTFALECHNSQATASVIEALALS